MIVFLTNDGWSLDVQLQFHALYCINNLIDILQIVIKWLKVDLKFIQFIIVINENFIRLHTCTHTKHFHNGTNSDNSIDIINNSTKHLIVFDFEIYIIVKSVFVDMCVQMLKCIQMILFYSGPLLPLSVRFAVHITLQTYSMYYVHWIKHSIVIIIKIDLPILSENICIWECIVCVCELRRYVVQQYICHIVQIFIFELNSSTWFLVRSANELNIHLICFGIGFTL